MRVRMFCLADSHIISSVNQAQDVIKEVLDLIDYIAKVLGLKKGQAYRYRLSLGDRKDNKKYYKDDIAWDNAEEILRKVLKETKSPHFEAEGEAAFYGPKIDVQMKKISGKEETAFTVQYDFVMPKRFNMTYINEKGREEQPIVIHRSSIGAIEMVMALLIERYNGNFPTWLSPVQVKVLPITDRNSKYSKEVIGRLSDEGIRAELDDRSERLQAKILDTQLEKIQLFLREVHGFHITSRSGGKVMIDRTNVAIDLAPYAIPLDNALLLVPAALLRGRHPYLGTAYLGAAAFFFAMHLHFSAEGFLDGQPDVCRSGRRFSAAVVLLFLMLWLPFLAAPAARGGFRGLPSLYRDWAGEGVGLARMLLEKGWALL